MIKIIILCTLIILIASSILYRVLIDNVGFLMKILIKTNEILLTLASAFMLSAIITNCPVYYIITTILSIICINVLLIMLIIIIRKRLNIIHR